MIHSESHSRSHSEITVPAGGRRLPGELHLPAGASGVVLLAHGGGTTYRSVQNRLLARKLQGARLATLALDLLDEDEAHERHNVWDVDLQAARLIEAARWLRMRSDTRRLRLGYFGASTGAGAVLLAAAREPKYVSAVVSGAGRPDMALYWLPRVAAPTLFVVGERDVPILECNDQAFACLKAETKKLVVVPNAANLLEEPDGLETLAAHACRWFARFLAPAPVSLAVSGETVDVE